MKSDASYAMANRLRTICMTTLVAFLGIFFILPLIWMLATSLKPTPQTLKDPVNVPLWERLSVMWVPQSEETAKVEDKVKPVYKTQMDGKDATGELVAKTPDGKVQLSVVTPAEFAGKVITVDQKDIAPEPREGSVFVGMHGITNVRAVAMDDPKTGDTRFAIVEPANLAGQQFTAPRDSLHVISHPDFRWDNFGKAWRHDATGPTPEKPDTPTVIPFLLQFRNSLLLVILIVSGVVVSNSMAAYAFARLSWPGRNLIFALTLATMMIPFPVTMVPMFGLFKSLGWIGTFRPLWVPAWFGAAFNIFLLRQFFMGIPKELSEAAKLDGCSEFRIFYQIILPLAKPALAVVALFSFLGVWNDFLGPLIYLQDANQFTLPVGLNSFKSQAGGVDINLLMAAATIVITPIIVTYFFAQKLFMQGIAATGLKG